MRRFGAERRLRKFFNRDLTDEKIWEEIINQKRLDNIHQLKSIVPEAARALVQMERRMELLSLGISVLSAETARELVQYKGDILLLNCVKEISPGTAAALARFKGVKLGLNGTKKMSMEAFKALAPYKGILLLESLEDPGIDQKNKQEAELIFKMLNAAKLCLNGIKTSSLQLLRIIAKIPGELELNGIHQLSPAEAAGLVSHKGKNLKLKGLTAVPPALARILIKYNGIIDIGGARNVPDETISILAAQPVEQFLLHPVIKRHVDECRRKTELETREKEAAIRREQKEREQRKKEIQEHARKLLKEFEEFDTLNLVSTETAAETGQISTSIKTIEKTSEDKDSRESRLNYEITKKKSELNTLLRKGPDKLTEEENRLVTELRAEIEQLKEDIKGMLNLLIEKREVGMLCFTSSSDLATYLIESGAEDDEDNALVHLDDFDLFGNTTDEDDIDLFGDRVEITGEEDENLIKGNNFILREI
jgi:hypothetical protein